MHMFDRIIHDDQIMMANTEICLNNAHIVSSVALDLDVESTSTILFHDSIMHAVLK